MTTMSDILNSVGAGYQNAQNIQYGPQMAQLEMLQKKANLDQTMGLDPVSHQNISASRTNQALAEESMKAKQFEQAKAALTLAAAAVPMFESGEDEKANQFLDALGALAGKPIPKEVRNPETLKAIFEAGTEKEKIQQVPGMPGYYFDPNDKSQPFKIDSKLGASIAKTQQELKNKERWDIDATEKVNSKVTALIKPAVDIHSSAVALEGLRKSGSAAAKLAAIFKFMKALDPTSVVRETEQGQVYEAQGVAAQFAGMANNIIGEGRLMESGFDDLVNTAKVLSNAAIKSADESVTGFLDVFGTLPQSNYGNLKKRVPKLFEIKSKETTQAIPPQIPENMRGRWSNLSPDEQAKVLDALSQKQSNSSGQGKRR